LKGRPCRPQRYDVPRFPMAAMMTTQVTAKTTHRFIQ